MDEVIDLYVKAIDLAKQKEGLSNQDKMILNRFKLLLRSDAADKADKEFVRIGKVTINTLLKVKELAESIFEDWVRNLDLAESIFEDWVRNLDIVDEDRDRMLDEGKHRADSTVEYLLTEMRRQGLIVEN